MNKSLENSLKDRIKTLAKAHDRSFNELWKSLVLERFLVRLSRPPEAERLIFKGGYLLSKYLPLGRETRDLDFSLSGIEATIEPIRSLIQQILSQPYDDGFTFDELKVQEMAQPHMDYPGFRVTANAYLGRIKTDLIVDLWIGDYVSLVEKTVKLLSVNNKPLFESEIALQVYPLSYIFAEKLETVVSRGEVNSRTKDFHDILLISESPHFDLNANVQTIRLVFAHRCTPLPERLVYEEDSFAILERNWSNLLRKLSSLDRARFPQDFAKVVSTINDLVAV